MAQKSVGYPFTRRVDDEAGVGPLRFGTMIAKYNLCLIFTANDLFDQKESK